MTDKINEMWTALVAYQIQADANGHGESWALMCSERTERAANIAYDAAYAAADAADAAWSAAKAAYAAWSAVDAANAVENLSQRSINHIKNAKGETA